MGWIALFPSFWTICGFVAKPSFLVEISLIYYRSVIESVFVADVEVEHNWGRSLCCVALKFQKYLCGHVTLFNG